MQASTIIGWIMVVLALVAVGLAGYIYFEGRNPFTGHYYSIAGVTDTQIVKTELQDFGLLLGGGLVVGGVGLWLALK